MSLENEIRQMDRLNVWRRNHFNQYRVIIVRKYTKPNIFWYELSPDWQKRFKLLNKKGYPVYGKGTKEPKAPLDSLTTLGYSKTVFKEPKEPKEPKEANA